MKTLFISDLHLDEHHPEISSLFLHFLQKEAITAEALYILGDFFEVWIGDDNLTPFNRMIIQALKEATKKGLPIYIMRGNRDFLLGKTFLKNSGCKLLPDEHVINLYGVPTLLMHGDTLCTLDTEYLKFRQKTRRWWVQKLFLWKSLKKRQAIAKTMRTVSQEHIRYSPNHIMDVTQSEVERVMQQYHVHQLIHGHTHRENIHHFMLQDQPAIRIVLGAWHEHGSVLVCDSNHHTELVKMT